MRSNKLFIALLTLAFFAAGNAWAQGLTTATLSGRVINEGQGLPGVSVAVTSPALQGTRSTVTGNTGEYVFVNMPPGAYTVTFALSGFQPQTTVVKLSVSQVSRLDATLGLTAIAAEATVVGKTESISQTTAEATTYTADLLTKLPTARTVTSAVLLSPGVNANGLNGVSIAGAQSTENLYTVNGVVIQDNVRNTPNNLFIEDAIQETTTMTSGVSAEYGRFSGGIVNTITKSGGNTFSGSLRSTLTNDSWRAMNAYTNPTTGVNPQTGQFVQKLVPTWEATFGGPILKDKVWFFAAGRFFDTSSALSTNTALTNIPVAYGAKETRYEGKLTLSPVQNHTLTGSYIGIEHTDANYWFPSYGPADLGQFYNRQTPQSLFNVNYNGVLTNSLFVDAFYSRRKFTFENSGGTFADVVNGTPIRDLNRAVIMNAPVFCGFCKPELRNNNDYVVKATYFLSTTSAGSHNIVGGYDDFGTQRDSNNYQSGSNFFMYTPYSSIVQGQNIYPVIDANTEIDYWPVLQQSQGSDLRTRSAFLNDTWRMSNLLSFNLGVRYDKNHATDAAGNVTSNDSAWSPRLAAILDVKGDGKLKVTASYAKYVSALQETQAGSGATLAGSPADFYWYYGDMPGFKPINTGTGPYLSSADALRQFFAIFGGAGCLPDPTVAGCKVPQGGAPSIGGVNLQIQGSLASPNATEWVLGFSGSLGPKGTFRSDIVRRDYHDYYDLKKDLSTGQVASPVNPAQKYDLGLIVNSNDYTRNYTGLHTQFAYRLSDRFSLGGVWTWSHLIGDIVGETSGSGPTRGGLHAYPEYFDRKWSSPSGSLAADTRHRVRIYGTYDLAIPASLGSLNLSAIQAWDTGTPYAAAGSIKTAAYVTNPGYLTPPATVGYYFTARDTYRLEDVYSTDLSLTYSYKIGGMVELYITPQIYNIFNAQHVTNVNTAVNTNYNSSSLAAFNPFTNANPVECPQGQTLAQCKAMGANWQKGADFGKPTASTYYQNARTFQVAVGVRF